MIECNEKINFGMPALRGRRLTVHNIVTKLYLENGLATTLEDYAICLQDVKDAVSYCINQRCKVDAGRLHFCDGCVLRVAEEGTKFNKEDYIEYTEGETVFVRSKDGMFFFLGTLDEFEKDVAGRETWVIAEDVNRKFLSS